MSGWRDYVEAKGGGEHSVTGTVRVLEQVESQELGNRRDLLVYLPPSHGRDGRRYPVVYMHDGQNLFDRVTSFAGEWRVDETLETLSRQGTEAIVVGIPNTGLHRMNEYSPFSDPTHGGGRGDAYLRFVVETVKPLVDAAFQTTGERTLTGVLGSSMGGLISLYGLFRHPDVFGFAGAMSPAFWFARGAILEHVRQAPTVPARIYLDTGTHEGPRKITGWVSFRRVWRDPRGPAAQMHEVLRGKGYRDGQDLLYVEDRGGRHHEAAWGGRLPAALRFLLQDSAITAPAGPRV